jgi:acetate---CoA ligase (ADP-forming)
LSANLKSFLEPKSVAIVGASDKPGKAGHEIMSNLLANEYPGKIYPVNPGADTVEGYKAYASVKNLPQIPDVVVLLIPASATLEVLEECAQKGAKSVIIESGGFAEVDEQGVKLENKAVELAHSSGMRIMGPNTSGVISTPGKFITTFFPLGKIRAGSVSYVAQTGNFATHTMKWILTAENYGVSRVIGLGNKCDVDESEVIEFLGNDPRTSVICVYLEGFKSGRHFIEVAKAVSKKKPILVLKGGVTTGGTRAVATHTAALTTDSTILDGIFRQAGVTRIQRYTELIHVPKAMAFQPLPRGNRVAIFVPSGALGVLAADACESLGLKVAKLSEKTLQRIQEITPSWLKISNPVDIWAAGQTHGFERGYRQGMEAALADENVDAVISVLLLTSEGGPTKLDFVPELHLQSPSKPLIVATTGDKESFERSKAFLENRSIPVYAAVEEACQTLATMYRSAQMMER